MTTSWLHTGYSTTPHAPQIIVPMVFIHLLDNWELMMRVVSGEEAKLTELEQTLGESQIFKDNKRSKN